MYGQHFHQSMSKPGIVANPARGHFLDGVHCQKFTGTKPVVLKAVPVTGAAFSGFTMDQFRAPLLSQTYHYWYIIL